MRFTAKAVLVAVALAGAPVAALSPAMADSVTVTVDPGTVAFGYNDGYWDRTHQWHTWTREESTRYQTTNRDHYYDWRHDRDPGNGWRETDTWWERH